MLLNKKNKPKTVNRKLVSIRRFLSFYNNLPNNPDKVFAEPKLIKIQRQEYLEDVLTKNDFDRLNRAAEKANDKRAIALFNALYLTGARVSEIIQLKANDCENDFVSVRGKGGKYRDLFIPQALRPYIIDYLRGRETDANSYLFLNKRNIQPMDRQAVHKLIKKYAGLSKVKLSIAHAHSYRHLFGFRLVEEGYDLGTVADLLGHADINTTKIYTRKTKQELLRVINKLNS